MSTAKASIDYHLPAIPLTVIEFVHRLAQQRGSSQFSALCAHGDYTGHHVTVGYNDGLSYWITEYWWMGERHVLWRGQLEDCLQAAKIEYGRGAKGSSVAVSLCGTEKLSMQAGEVICRRLGFQEGRGDDNGWMAERGSWKYSEAGEAVRMTLAGVWVEAAQTLLRAEMSEDYQASRPASARNQPQEPLENFGSGAGHP